MSKFVIQASWDDVPHLTEEMKKDILKSYSPHERDARSKGIPQLGSGAIYPIPEADIVVKPFDIPAHWPRCYGFDVGWNNSAVAWWTYDVDNRIWYLYADYKRQYAEPTIHAQAIKNRGSWIPGVIDKAARGRSQDAGAQLINQYIDLGLILIPSDVSKTAESGILKMFDYLSTGRAKIFASCTNFLSEYPLYRRDERGNIVKENDHALDAARYGLESGEKIMLTPPKDYYPSDKMFKTTNPITGY